MSALITHSGQAQRVTLPVHMILWHLGDVLEREWPSRRLVRRLETLRHLSRRSLYHRTHTVVLFRCRHLHLR
ncbi:hypothetical protein Taro_011401 [Colocasia esculenta]|uniref:Uncharacterized protein n=1 Tax=Colocasia esculenta TaxID=4460 RepID=A0A843U658_COLES|nr:hypothetical protein [Colocasia esculenta]